MIFLKLYPQILISKIRRIFLKIYFLRAFPTLRIILTENLIFLNKIGQNNLELFIH